MEMKEGATALPEGEEKVVTEQPKTTATDSEVLKLKNALSKANSEAAEYKRQLRERQTKEEQAEADRAEAEKRREEELNALRAEVEASKRERTTATYSKSLLGAGYDAETADLIASTLPDGVSAEFFGQLKAFNDKQRQTLTMENYKQQPSLSTGLPPQPVDTELMKMREYIGL